MMKKLILYTCTGLLFFSVSLKAQVVVGTDKQPESFSALEIVSSTGGLRHPQMSTQDRDALISGLSDSDKPKAYGLVIYNTSTECLEYYKDMTEGWVNFCDEQNIDNIPLSTQNVILRPWDSSIDGLLSSGTAGKLKYDVATAANSSLEGSCGYVGAGRTTDFNSAADYIRNYVLEFPSTQNMSEISDLIVGTRQYIIDVLSASGAVSGTLSNRKNTIQANFPSNIATLAGGTDDLSALYTTIYAVYKRNGVMERVELRIQVMDCLGCGVRVQTGGKEWIRMGCYNCGVTSTTASPFVYNDAIRGGAYQWGRTTDGHEQISSEIYDPIIALGEITYPTAPKDSLNANGQPTGERAGRFIPVTTASSTYFYDDWSAQHDPVLWGDGTQNAVVAKGAGDPCPTGFRVPTKSEMEKISAALTWTAQGGTAKDDGVLFLPAVASRNTTGTAISANPTKYWTSTVFVPVSPNPDEKEVYVMSLNGTTPQFEKFGRANGAAVRCVSIESFKD